MSTAIVYRGGVRAAEARQRVVEMGVDLGAGEFCRQQLATMERRDCRDLLPAIRLPVRVLCGARDVITPIEANRYIADHVRGAALEIVENAGHLLPLERPGRVTTFLREWLAC